MSHQVIINYQGIAIELQAKCDVAIASLCKIDKTLDKVHQTASKLEDAAVKEYEDYLIKSKNQIRNEIDSFKKKLDEYRKMGTFSGGDADARQYNRIKIELSNSANHLSSLVNDLTGSKLNAIDQMINEGLLNKGNNVFETLRKKEEKRITVSKDLQDSINNIDDVSLRQLVLKEALKPENSNLSLEKLLDLGRKDLDELLGRGKSKIIQEYKQEMKENEVSDDLINQLTSQTINATTINQMNEAINSAKTSEKVRKETLKIIVKAIRARGFIVDTKNNLKIDKQKNIVRLVALKASGQKAEFEIQLNGKFMYHFDGYEGQACKKDIEPFMTDLKNIYDIDVLHTETIWENPDKIQHKKYQYVKENKGNN